MTRTGLLAAVLLLPLLGCDRGASDGADPAPPDPPAPTDVDGTPGDEAAEAAFLRVVEAEKTQVYSGDKITVHGERGVNRETKMKVLRYASGQTLLLWNDGGESARKWVYRSRCHWIDDPALLLENYRVELPEGESPRVAWRDTVRLTVTGRRGNRPSMELLVDAETSLVLQETLRGHDGRVTLTNLFESIRYGEPGGPRPEDAGAEHLNDRERNDPRPEGFKPLVVAQPPAGFRRVSRTVTAEGELREYWCDGLAGFLVVQGPAGAGADEGVPEGELARSERGGQTWLRGVLSGIRVSVEGNLPAADLEAVVRGLVALD